MVWFLVFGVVWFGECGIELFGLCFVRVVAVCVNDLAGSMFGGRRIVIGLAVQWDCSTSGFECHCQLCTTFSLISRRSFVHRLKALYCTS